LISGVYLLRDPIIAIIAILYLQLTDVSAVIKSEIFTVQVFVNIAINRVRLNIKVICLFSLEKPNERNT